MQELKMNLNSTKNHNTLNIVFTSLELIALGAYAVISFNQPKGSQSPYEIYSLAILIILKAIQTIITGEIYIRHYCITKDENKGWYYATLTFLVLITMILLIPLAQD
jgi:hypothetical protein